MKCDPCSRGDHRACDGYAGAHDTYVCTCVLDAVERGDRASHPNAPQSKVRG